MLSRVKVPEQVALPLKRIGISEWEENWVKGALNLMVTETLPSTD